MHSVALSEEAMETDAETLAQGIVLTADVSCLKALLEIRDEIVAAGHTPSAEVPTPGPRRRHREVAGAQTAPPQRRTLAGLHESHMRRRPSAAAA